MNCDPHASLTKDERKALLRVRYAGRYDPNGVIATLSEGREEQRASRGIIPHEVWLRLQARGWITSIPIRLTDAGRDALDRDVNK